MDEVEGRSLFRRSLPARARHQFPAAIWAETIHFIGATRAEGTLERADESFAIAGQKFFASLTFRAHLERHRLARLFASE
jgi:hypothetical protein